MQGENKLLPSFASLLAAPLLVDDARLSAYSLKSGLPRPCLPRVEPPGDNLDRTRLQPGRCSPPPWTQSNKLALTPEMDRDGQSRPTGLPPRSVRKYTNARASNHCHICQRSSKAVPSVACANIRRGTCRKIICELCFEAFNIDRAPPVASVEESTWLCTHCTLTCPRRAQCWTYRRTNSRRRERRQLRASKRLLE